MTLLIAKPTATAGEPIARLMLEHSDRQALNGVLYRLDKRVKKPDAAMSDRGLGRQLWGRLTAMLPPS